MDNPKHVARLVLGEIRRATGKRYPELEKALEGMEARVLWEFYRMMQDIGHEMTIARKRPMWPGGPRI